MDEYKIEQEDLPDKLPYEIKPLLKRAVQLRKRYRNVYYKSNLKQAPASIIITTLCGNHYDKSISEFKAIKNILISIKKEIDETDGILELRNPANKDEIITESFNKENYMLFIQFIKDFILKWDKLENSKSILDIKNVLEEMFEENIAGEAIKEQAQYIEQQRKAGILSAKSTGIISSVNVANTQPIPKNTFYGG